MEDSTGAGNGTKERILSATLNIIGEEGFQNVTVRKIAVRARVNVAAVNYHFGSKERVVNEALRYMTGSFRDCFKLLRDPEFSPEDRLRNFLRSYSAMVFHYPDVFKNLIRQVINNTLIPVEYLEFLRGEGFEEFKYAVTELKGPGQDEMLLFMRFFQTISSVSVPVLLGPYMRKLSGVDYSEEEIRNRYVEVVLGNILHY